jgi:hypothetical protein
VTLSARGAAVATAWLLAVVVALLAFRALASALTARHLAQEARSEVALLRAGQPLWRWRFLRPDDFVAGRAFGQASMRAVDGGVEVTSLDGTAFELGLPIARGLDLVHWPLLRLDRTTPHPVTLEVVWQMTGRPACLSAPIAWRNARLEVDLRSIGTTAAACAPVNRADMFRLRITMPRGRRLLLADAALLAPDPLALVPPQAALDSSSVAHSTNPAPAAPVVRLAATASAEQLLTRRDAAVAWRPAALVVAGDASLTRPPRTPLPPWISWLGVGAYGLALRWLSRRPRPAWQTLLAGLLGPLILVAGLQWGQRPTVTGVVGFASALMFAAHAQRAGRSSGWRWIGPWRSVAWWLPLALVPVALLVCLVWGHALEPTPPRRALVYLGWAALQQWLILGFALGQLEKFLPTHWAVLAAALAFALLHVPNGALMQLCFLAELWWAWCFVRQRSLLPIALAHAAGALVVGAGLIGDGLRSLEVSARFFL